MLRRFLEPAVTSDKRSMSNFGRLAAAIDEKTGIVRRVDVLRNSSNDPRVYCAVAESASLDPILGYSFDNRGGACAVTKARAMVRAVGECVERYSSAFCIQDLLRRASVADLENAGSKFYPTKAFYAFSPVQRVDPSFPYAELDDARLIHWVGATDFHTNNEVLVPASCVYLPYVFPDEPVTHAPISTGLAAGVSPSDCIEKGVAEIVERDALMISWKCSDVVPALNVASCLGVDPVIDMLLKSTQHLPGSWHLNLLTRDIEAPVISAAFIAAEGQPLTSFGISANKDVKMALRGALEEALLSRFLINRSSEVINWSEDEPRTYRTLRDHLFGHAISRSLKAKFFEIFGHEEDVSLGEIIQRFSIQQTVVDAVREAGMHVLYTDVTSEDVGALGVHCVRSLIPFAEPLDADHEFQHLGGMRLCAAKGREGVFNSNPHPFP